MVRKQAQLDQASHQCGLIGGKEAGGSDKGDDIGARDGTYHTSETSYG